MPQGPFKLVSVNKNPARAKLIIGRVVEATKDTYTINYVANAERIEDVKETVLREKPDLLFVASMWTPEEASKIQAIAKEADPSIKTVAIPEGLQVQQGPDGVFAWLMEHVPEVIAS